MGLKFSSIFLKQERYIDMIILKKPQNGSKVDLLTDIQIKFLESDRTEANAENFDYLNLERTGGKDYTFPRPVIFEWESTEEAAVQISESETFEIYFSFVGNNVCAVENFKSGTRYFWRVVCHNAISEVFYFDTADRFPRFIKIDGMTNVRDFGGWKTDDEKIIKQGILYRGSELNSHVNVTTDGLKTMEDVLKIKSVLDLRGKSEVVENVYRHKYINVPVSAYGEWFGHPNSTREIFEFLCDEKNYPIYFHCWGGADRTGTLAFLLGALLGMSYEDLLDEYEITSLSIWGVRTRNSEKHFKSFMQEFNAIEGQTIKEKAENHFLSTGVSKMLIEKFRDIMLCEE